MRKGRVVSLSRGGTSVPTDAAITIKVSSGRRRYQSENARASPGGLTHAAARTVARGGRHRVDRSTPHSDAE